MSQATAQSQPDVTESSAPGLPTTSRRRSSDWLNRGGLFFAWAALTVTFTILEPGRFATSYNIQALFSTQSVLLVLAIGMIVPLVSGDLDLSPPATMGVVLMTIGVLNVDHGWSMGASVLAGFAVGTAMGLINALLVVVIGVDSIVATLGMSTLLSGVALGLSTLPLSLTSDVLTTTMTRQIGGLQCAFFIAVAVCIVVWYALTQTASGRHLYVVGASRPTAELSGLPVKRLRAAGLVVASLAASLAAVMFAGLFGSANPTTAPQMLLPALAAVFLGSTAVTPGRFNVLGTFAAVYFLVFGISGLEIRGLSGWVSQAFYGGSLVVAVVLSRLGAKRGAA